MGSLAFFAHLPGRHTSILHTCSMLEHTDNSWNIGILGPFWPVTHGRFNLPSLSVRQCCQDMKGLRSETCWLFTGSGGVNMKRAGRTDISAYFKALNPCRNAGVFGVSRCSKRLWDLALHQDVDPNGPRFPNSCFYKLGVPFRRCPHSGSLLYSVLYWSP